MCVGPIDFQWKHHLCLLLFLLTARGRNAEPGKISSKVRPVVFSALKAHKHFPMEQSNRQSSIIAWLELSPEPKGARGQKWTLRPWTLLPYPFFLPAFTFCLISFCTIKWDQYHCYITITILQEAHPSIKVWGLTPGFYWALEGHKCCSKAQPPPESAKQRSSDIKPSWLAWFEGIQYKKKKSERQLTFVGTSFPCSYYG